jgi:hypothetical protein
MSKLEEQKALPRRKLFKVPDWHLAATERTAREVAESLKAAVKPKPRKAKKAKGKR